MKMFLVGFIAAAVPVSIKVIKSENSSSTKTFIIAIIVIAVICGSYLLKVS